MNVKPNLTTLLFSFLIFNFVVTHKTVHAQNHFTHVPTPGGGSVFNMKNGPNGEMYITEGTGLYKSVNQGNTWIPTGFQSSVASIEIDTNTNTFFIGNSTGVYISHDCCSTWQATEFTTNAAKLMLTGNNTLLIGYWGGISMMNTDGTNVQRVLSISNTAFLEAFLKHPTGLLFAAITHHTVPSSGIFRSMNNGLLWNPTSLNRGAHALKLDSRGEIYSAQSGYMEGLYKTKNLGSLWTAIKTGVYVTDVAITPDDVVYISCTGELGGWGGVARTADDGVTWEILNNGLGSTDLHGLFISNDYKLFTWNGYLYRSTFTVWDSTYTIRAKSSPTLGGTIAGAGTFPLGSDVAVTATPTESYRFVCWLDNTDTLSTESSVTITMTRPYYLTAKFARISDIETLSKQEFRVFPNPFQDYVTIDATVLSQQGICAIEIWSATGKLVFVQTFPYTDNATLDVSHLSAGIYMVAVSTPEQRFVRKIVKN